ncbi:hypothetical protein CCP3SC15_250015 [Gammaproteobacteria bacterium]
MADYLIDMAADYPGRLQEAKAKWTKYRSAALELNLDGRLLEQIAFLMLGNEAALSHWLKAGSITQEEYETELSKAWEVLYLLAKEHGKRIKDEQPAETFIYTLRELFTVGEVHVRAKEDEDDGEPVHFLSYSG